MTGYIEYDRVEAHCLSRLGAADWEALLHRPEDEREQQRLGQEIATLELERDRQRALLEMAERRAEDAWLQGDEERTATAERALKRLREALAAADERLTASKQGLARLRARPQSVDQAAAMRTQVAEFVASIRQASGAERLAFNRWLLTREPAIAFRLCIDADGPKDARWRRAHTELFVGGESLGLEGVPIWSDKLAIEAGSPGLRQVVSVGQAGSVTLVNTAWVDAFDSQEAAAAKLNSAADANRDLAAALQRRGGDLDGSKGAVIEG